MAVSDFNRWCLMVSVESCIGFRSIQYGWMLKWMHVIFHEMDASNTLYRFSTCKQNRSWQERPGAGSLSSVFFKTCC